MTADPTNPAADTAATTVAAILNAHGLSLDDISALVAAQAAGSAPHCQTTVRQAVAAAVQAMAPGTVKTYGTYWRVLADGITIPGTWKLERRHRYLVDLAAIDRELKSRLELPADLADCPVLDDGRVVIHPGFGDQPLTAVTTFDVERLVKWVRASARARAAEIDRERVAAGRGVTRVTGSGAGENLVAATRTLYRASQRNGFVPKGCNPAAGVKKPSRRSASNRRPLTDAELADVWTTCATSGNDPELDTLILRLQLETACRQEGCINLKLKDLDDERHAVWLDQKGDSVAFFPVTAALLHDLRAFAGSRGALHPEDYVLRQRRRNKITGDPNPPLTSRRFDNIHERIRTDHTWARIAGFSSHWLRHHVAARIEAIGGRPCKMRLLNHQPNGQTDMYGKASFEELAWAHGQMTGTRHPHAKRPPWVTG